MLRTYSELIQLTTFQERFNYLKLNGSIGVETFGFDRYINQKFYKSDIWRDIRNYVITRDNFCDLGVDGYDIVEGDTVIIHHMNPIDINDIINKTDFLLNPEYLITTILRTHNGIHYGKLDDMIPTFVERYPNDTSPWR